MSLSKKHLITEDYFNCESYLKQYWPKNAKHSEVWKENKWLLEKYIKIGKLLKKDGARFLPFKALEISTGPTLAPLIPFLELLDNIQLSDYSPTNRKILKTMDIHYWTNYVQAVIELEGKITNKANIKRRLALLDRFRNQEIVPVDIKSTKPFPAKINYKNFNLFIMHFVADSITNDKSEYFKILKKILKMVDIDNYLIMSSLIDCKTWDDGLSKYPSPKLSIEEIVNFLLKNNFSVKYAEKSPIEDGVGLDGGMGVILAQKGSSI